MKIECNHVKRLFASEDRMYMVVIYKKKDGEKFTAIGSMLPIARGVNVVLEGEFENGKKGEFFNVKSFEIEEPKSQDQIINYLTTMRLPGVGKDMAERIVKALGKDTLHVLEMEPERLQKVKGLNKSKAEKIHEAFLRQRSLKMIVDDLKELELNAEMAVAIQKRYGDRSRMIIKEKPYYLSYLEEISFPQIEKVMGNADPYRLDRIQTAIFYAFELNEKSGNLFFEREQIVQTVLWILKGSVTQEWVCLNINELVKKQQLIYSNGKLYTKPSYEAETETAKNIVRLLKGKSNTISEKRLTDDISKIETKLGIQLADKQKEAIKMAVNNMFCIVTGGPGTGKSTTINSIVEILEMENKKAEICFCAPTGKAARRMTECTGREAYTMHQTLGITNKESYKYAKEIEEDIIIGDEFSMVDQYLAQAFFRSIKNGKRVILVGDVDQLPSVGPGSVFRELIECKEIPVTYLDVVFRQAQDNSIIGNSHKINHGETDIVFDENTMFVECGTDEEIEKEVLSKVLSSVESYGIDNVQTLSPYRKNTIIGTNSLNQSLKKLLNPIYDDMPFVNIRGFQWSINDKIMMTKNMELVSNGDPGEIVNIIKNGSDVTLDVKYENGSRIVHTKKEVEDYLELNYACTIHKSQGSEYPVVIIPLSMSHKLMLKRNLLYTAVTRAKKKVILIGQRSALNHAIMHNDNVKRNTLLGQRIIGEVNT